MLSDKGFPLHGLVGADEPAGLASVVGKRTAGAGDLASHASLELPLPALSDLLLPSLPSMLSNSGSRINITVRVVLHFFDVMIVIGEMR